MLVLPKTLAKYNNELNYNWIFIYNLFYFIYLFIIKKKNYFKGGKNIQ